MIRRPSLKKIVFAYLALGLAMLLPAAPAAAKKGKKDAIARATFIPADPPRWEAFLKGEQGQPYLLLQPVERNPDEHWLGLDFTEWDGPRFRLAIMNVENKIAVSTVTTTDDDDDDQDESEETTSRAAIPLGALEGLVTSGLFNTHRFELIERKQIKAVMAELKFNTTDLVSAPSASKVGRLLGAQYMLFAEVAEWKDDKNFMNTFGFAKKTAQVALTFRLLEVATGRIEYSRIFRGEAGSLGLTLPIWSQKENSPVHYALSICVAKAAYDLAISLKDKQWNGAVAKIDGEIATINAGSTQGMKPGMALAAYAKGEEVIDPTTGASLGTDDELIGSLQITSVKENLSKAVVIEGCRGLKVGDRVEVQEGAAVRMAPGALPSPPAVPRLSRGGN